jgi:hypothetical protein
MKLPDHLNPEYTFCMLKEVMCKDSLCGPVPVVLAFPEWVVLYSTEVDNTPDGVVPLTRFNHVGERLVSVLLKYIDYFMTADEAGLLTLSFNKQESQRNGARI